MNVISIGVDIEEISRFSSNKFASKKSFYKKIFTPEEIKYCMNYSNPYPHFAARFCAKEATIKAINKKLRLSNIEIKMKGNRPTLKLPRGIKGMVSLSHTKKYAIAFVVICDGKNSKLLHK